MSDDLSLWTIYDHPTDMPDGFVVRRWQITKGGAVPDPEARLAMTLEEARTLIPPGLYRLERVAEDDPKIVETWL